VVRIKEVRSGLSTRSLPARPTTPPLGTVGVRRRGELGATPRDRK
jgi:hypothetical protein